MTLEARFQLERGEFALDAQLTIPSQGITALFGPSGCGKTTLLRAMAGLERCPSGYLRLVDTVWQNGQLFVPPHRRQVGFVFQQPSLFSHLSVRGNLRYGLTRVAATERRLQLDEVVEWLALEPLLTRRPDGLSGGEQQRVAIGRALLASPKLLLMDEPLSALDEDSKRDILPFLERLHAELEIPVLYVSHATEEVARFADHLALMADGRIVAHGAIDEMLTRLDLPLARRSEAESVLEAAVAGHDSQYALTEVDFAGGRFVVPRQDLTIGQGVRLRILARDVSLALHRHGDTSILNIFPAKVAELHDDGEARVTVRLDVGGSAILSRVTRRSAAALELQPGKELFAQVKSVALLT